ncbi:MAG: HPr-rel-A system PqqD family peptide chaperone [Halioglobus sp.]|nr:HPr-rel-A system PqqD family peptide chaperone [Halioglobus sp.]
MTWRVHSAGKFYDPGEATVIYFDTRSGDTHLLSGFAAHILMLLEAQSMTTEHLVERVAADTDNGDAGKINDAVTAILDELLALDILKRD